MKLNNVMISCSSNVGLIRHNNEDMILVRNKFVRDENYSANISLKECDRFIMAVADGTGLGWGLRTDFLRPEPVGIDGQRR